MSLDKLLEKAKEYNLSQEIIDSRESGRIEFVSKFPIDQIGKLQIDEYVAGTDKNSFSYWLEFKKILFGIGGGNASKFGLYKGANGNYYGGTGQNKILLKGKELEKQFEIIKTGIIKALDYVKNDRISEIKALNIPIWNMVLQKILTLYYPDKFITIGASDVLIESAKDISLDGIELIPENLIQINYECKKKLDTQAFFKDWSYEKIGSLIWATYYEDSKRDYYILGSKYGENNNVDVFPDMLTKSVISVGFASKYDLAEYFQAKPVDIAEFLEKKGEEQKSINALKHFLSIKVGDRIAIKASGSPKGTKGFLSIVGIAEVIEKDGKIYEHDPKGLGHIINVTYLNAPVYKEFELGGYGSTMHKLAKPAQIDLIFKGEYTTVPISGNDFNSVLTKFEKSDLDFYFNFLRTLIKHFDMHSRDERLVFSIRDNSLNFTIGQRYCWNLFVADKKGKFGVISTDKLKENSGRFDGTDSAPYYTHFDEVNSVYENSKPIYNALDLELKRTKKSSFRKFNNIDFENYVFNVTQHLNKNKMNYKEEYTTWLNRINPNDGGTKSSYLRAIEILSTIVKYNIFEVDNLNEIDFLYEDLIKEQRIEGGKYNHKEAPSYGNKGFYSAAIKTYSDFLKQYKKPNTITFMEPLNTILFGPPGTGKTYNSINQAISIVNPGFNTKQDRKLVKEEYDRLEKDNRILFSTFHQSMSYEDFIEGIKPLPPKPNEPLNYDIQAGIFKIACARAAYLCYKKYNQAKGLGKSNYTFDDLYNAFIESIKPSIKNNQFPIYKTITGKDVEIFEVNSQDSIKARAKGSKATHVAPLTQENLEKLYNKYNSASEIKNLDEIRDTVQVSPRSTEFYAVFDGLKQFEKTYKPDNTIIEEDVVVDTTEDAEKIKKFTAGIYNDAIKQFGKEAEPIVLIIDEINRGNVSQIFGELITLIEDDKRIGKSESLEVILPYSKLKFGVPPNLHLIGTMNTADRSVEALDTALRRRFVFEEIPPKYDLKELQYEYAGFKAFEILQTINKRIEKLLDKDHLIGHSYFILKDGEKPNEKLKNSFYKSILPLLQEYFFGDFGKIGLVLGQGFVNLKNWDDKVDSFAEFDHESSGDFESKDVYEIIDYREPTNYEVNKVKMDFEKAIKRLMKLNIA